MKYLSLIILFFALSVTVSCNKNVDDNSFSLKSEKEIIIEDIIPQESKTVSIVEAETDINQVSLNDDSIQNSNTDNNTLDVKTLIFGSTIYKYDKELGGYTISASGLDNQLVIIPKIDGIPVVSIADDAFFGMKELRGNLELPSTIKKIGERAFYGCSGLTGDLFIPDSVEEIGISAFENCYGFDGILYIGKGLRTINDRVFYNCSSLSGDLLIPNNIEFIGSCAFFNSISLKSDILFTSKEIDVATDAFMVGGVNEKNNYFYFANYYIRQYFNLCR